MHVDDSDSDDEEKQAPPPKEEPLEPYPDPVPLSFEIPYNSDDDERIDEVCCQLASPRSQLLLLPQDEEEAKIALEFEQKPELTPAQDLFPNVSVEVADMLSAAEQAKVESKIAVMSTSSSVATPSNLLYADTHSPYLFVNRGRQPLTIWVRSPPSA